jgi:hypothetical protein
MTCAAGDMSVDALQSETPFRHAQRADFRSNSVVWLQVVICADYLRHPLMPRYFPDVTNRRRNGDAHEDEPKNIR